ncbi:MAG: hypothetical protein KF831_12775 [Acidobacteria bacterium]|nr:hypothetical protein [Acidobacteriota bacterium]
MQHRCKHSTFAFAIWRPAFGVPASAGPSYRRAEKLRVWSPGFSRPLELWVTARADPHLAERKSYAIGVPTSAGRWSFWSRLRPTLISPSGKAPLFRTGP